MKLLNRITKGNSRSVAVKKNIAGTFFTKGIGIIISLILVPMTIGYMSSELYGVWLTISSLMTWLSFFDIGFTHGLKNKLTEAIAKGDWKRGKALVSTTYILMCMIFIPLCIVLLGVVPHVNWASILNVDSIYETDIIRALYVLCICFCLQMITNVLVAVIAAFQKIALSSIFPVIGQGISLCVIYILSIFSVPNLVYLALAISTMPIIVVGLSSIYLYKTKFQKVCPSFVKYDKTLVKDLFSLGLKFFLIQIQFVVLYQTTNFLISSLSGPNEVTTYNIAYKYLCIAMMAYNIILSPIWPAMTDAYAKRDYIWMNNIYKKMGHIFIFSCIALLIMVLSSNMVYNIWIGDKIEIPYLMTILVAIYMMIHNWDSLQIQLINGIGKLKLQTYITFVGLVLHIPLSFCLGQIVGAYGVLTSMITINIIYSIFFTIQVNKLINNKAHGIWAK